MRYNQVGRPVRQHEPVSRAELAVASDRPRGSVVDGHQVRWPEEEVDVVGGEAAAALPRSRCVQDDVEVVRVAVGLGMVEAPRARPPPRDRGNERPR